MPYDLGATARLTAECRDPGGALATAASATLTITLPDGTTAIPAVAPVGPGTYQADYATTVAGRHMVRWLFTGPAHAYTDQFDVRPQAPLGLLSLKDARTHLNITGPQHDDELRGWVESVTAAVEWFVGPVVVRTVTETHSAGRMDTLALLQPPVLALTAVDAVVTGRPSYAVVDLDLDAASGVVRRKDGGWLYGPLRATYSAGRRIVPAAVSSASKIILQHLWRTQQGPGRPQLGVDDYAVSEPIPGLGYAIPHRALQLLDPYRLPPGVG
ncbi:hypothetical protein ACGFRG_08005 [Streptomyces sp. NPDC048696]|uniref:hypothetical protein n=1 Tax=Streptomyces sp. NPDC048696 TaxID=3365585 RepID=UPI00371BEB4E